MNHQISVSESMAMKGNILIREWPLGTVERFNAMIAEGRKEEVKAEIASMKPVFTQRNLIMQAANLGKDLIIQRLCGVNTYSCNILWGDIGTGTTAPAITDTALTTPSARTALSLATDVSSNQAQLQFFFTDSALSNVTFSEFGTFVDGSSSLSSGQMFNHALFSPYYTKSTGTDITVEVDLTIN